MSKVRYVRLTGMCGAILLGAARILEGSVVDGVGLIMAALSSTNVINRNGPVWR